MKFRCPNCKKGFSVHPFIGMRHPSQAKCPLCGAKGGITEKGRQERKSRFHAMNQANKDAEQNRKLSNN